MPHQPSSEEWFVALGSNHRPGMRPEVRRTLLRLTAGATRSEIAAEEGVEQPTVKRWIDTATAEIASTLPAEHPGRGELRGAWVVAHLSCCLTVELGAAG